MKSCRSTEKLLDAKAVLLLIFSMLDVIGINFYKLFTPEV